MLLMIASVGVHPAHGDQSEAAGTLPVKAIETPAAPGSQEPSLFAGDDGRIYLSWVEPLEERRFALRFATREATGWSPPRTIAQGANWFVNWADFPSLVAFGAGSLAAHWRERNGGNSPYAYDIKLAYSMDDGLTWSAPVVPHRDATQTQHGFVSVLPGPGGGISLVWLDGRNTAATGNDDAAAGSMTLRFAAVNRRGQLVDEAQLDARVCTCCQTAAALTREGMVVAYRDRSPGEIRDIAVVRRVQARWSKPRTVHDDGWRIAGCPVNGPAIAAAGDRVALAWFTGANNEPRVRLAFSEDSGATFDEPIRVDDGDAMGRVDVVLLADDSALVSWMAFTATGPTLRARRIRPAGPRGHVVTVGESSAGMIDGFPRTAHSNGTIYFTWTEAGTPSTIRVAVLELDER